MWSNPQDTPDFVTFTEEILNGKLHFLCGVRHQNEFVVCFSVKTCLIAFILACTFFEIAFVLVCILLKLSPKKV